MVRHSIYLGTEPNTVRRPWDAAEVRWLLAASWDYSQAAGNMAIPALYDAIHKAKTYCLADRWYLPATPRDMELLEKAQIPVFGIESRHQLRDFDVVGTSISYTVLFMNFCNTSEAPIWMSDKSFKPISKVQAGDEVMGWYWPETKDGKQPIRRLCKTKVLRITGRQTQVVRATLESGRVIRCTPDHKWLAANQQAGNNGVDRWTHVGGSSTSYEYAEAGALSTKYNTKPGSRTVLGTLSELVEPTPELTPEQQREADWLAGVYDGEGHANSIAQCSEHNPAMCARIEKALDMLGIPWTVATQNGCCRQYRMCGGRRTYVHWLNWTNGVRREWFEKQIDGGRLGKRADRVVKIEPDGVDTVYSMETETGNYVAWGFASSNCKYLTMSGVPLRWRDREPGDYPMVMVGGQAWCAPEFMSPVVDCVWLGEAEDEDGNPGIAAVCERIAQFKRDGAWSANREGCYLALAREYKFLYFPRFTGVAYRYEDRGLPNLTKMVSGYQALAEGVGPVFRSRRVRDLNAIDMMTSAPVLFSDPGMGSGDVEIGRGCTCWCTFCKISWVNKPYVQEAVARTVPRALEWRRNMGSVDISLVAPDPPVHTRKKELIAALLENVTDTVDASSMRIDDYTNDPDFAMLLQVSGTTSVTFGLEGNSQLMRDLAGKGTSDDDVAKAVTQAIRAGVRKVKLYFITNWPGETRHDVMRVVELGKRLADIRDSFGPEARGVQIIFSWTPLLIESQTPMQWFAVTPPDYELAGAFRELMDSHRVWVKIGSKATPEKLAFFQACQRASRDVGEAITDVIEDYGTASWGGFPKDMRARLDAAMVARGFRNGLDDIFGERYFEDLLGWEMIDTGVKRSLMWRAYRDMVELLEGTDAGTYDENYGEGAAGGNEWVPRCDQQCSGNACGACGTEDLELRREYVQAVDRDLAAEPVHPVDHSTVALKVRMRVERPEEFRFVTSESLEFTFRRAAFLAQADMAGRSRTIPDIAVRSVRFASGGTGYRERSAGVDYAEFGLTRLADHADIGEYLIKVAGHLGRDGEVPWLRWAGSYEVLPAAAKLPARPVSLWDLEVAGDAGILAGRLAWWQAAPEVPVLIRAESFYTGATSRRGDAKDHVSDFWVVRDGHRVLLRMILHGQLGPYQAYAALTGKASWIEAARYTAWRREFFAGGHGQCEGCGQPVPSNLMDAAWSERYCPRCADEAEGRVIAALAAVGVLQVTIFTPCGGTCGQSRIQQDARLRRPVRHRARRQRRQLGGGGLHPRARAG